MKRRLSSSVGRVDESGARMPGWGGLIMGHSWYAIPTWTVIEARILVLLQYIIVEPHNYCATLLFLVNTINGYMPNTKLSFFYVAVVLVYFPLLNFLRAAENINITGTITVLWSRGW